MGTEKDAHAKNVHGWPQVYFSHSWGSRELGLDLYLTIERPLTSWDEERIAHALRELETDLRSQTARLSPQNLLWKADWIAKARTMFAEAGLGPIYVQEIDNEYCGPRCCPHRVWLLVTTPLGLFKVGWRKRVLEIDWAKSDVGARAEELFASENVTKGERHIHAYGYAKATAYLTALAASAGHAPTIAPSALAAPESESESKEPSS